MGGHKTAEKNQMRLKNVYPIVRKLHGMSSDFKLTDDDHVMCMTTGILRDPNFTMRDLSMESPKFQSIHKECTEMGLTFPVGSKKSTKSTAKTTSKVMKKKSYY